MERIDTLLEKYFRGVTSLTEEAEIRAYFASEHIEQKHEVYSALFNGFMQEKQIRFTGSLPKIKKTTNYRFSVKYFIWTGIAASLALILTTQIPWKHPFEKQSDYAIMMGKRIDDPEFAHDYAAVKMEKINNKLERSLRPVKCLETVNRSLAPIRKLHTQNGSALLITE